jgi:capsular exopolysaccharide synthesis family protein
MASQRDENTLPPAPVGPPPAVAGADRLGAGPPAVHPAPPANASLWLALRRRWLLALTAGLLLGGAAAGAAWFVRPARYTAYALVKIDGEHADLLPRDRAATDQELYRATQTALMTSPKVIEAALRQEKARQSSLVAEQSDPVAWLENALSVEPLRNTNLLRVALSAPHAAEAADLVNAVVGAYLHEVVHREQQQRLSRLKDLQEVCGKSEANLRRRRTRLQGVAESLKATNQETTSLRQKIALEEYVALRKELIGLGAQLRQITQSRAAGIRGASAEVTFLSDLVIEQALDAHPEVLAVARKAAEAEEALNQLQANAKPGYEGIEGARQKFADAKAKTAAVRARLRRGLEGRFQHRAAADTRRLADHEALLKAQYEDVARQVEERRRAADQIGLAAIRYETERSEIEQAEKVIRSLWAERERLEVEGRSNARRITVEVEAAPPRSKNRKPQVLAAGLAGCLFFFAGAFGVAFLDHRARRIYSRDEVVGQLRLRLLGSLPVLAGQPAGLLPAAPAHGQAGALPANTYGSPHWVEALTGLRTVLLHEAGLYGLQVVQVASAEPQEGKTTLASHLAASLAAAGRRTLLIDADLRRPVLHTVFALPAQPGLSEVLREETSPAEATHATAVAGLSLMPAGVPDSAVLALLAQGRLEGLMRQLRSQYDAVVIDSSPILAVSDALLVGRHVDAVVLSIRPHHSRVPVVQEACERLRSLHIPVLGTVLNGQLAGPSSLTGQYLSNALSVSPAQNTGLGALTSVEPGGRA